MAKTKTYSPKAFKTAKRILDNIREYYENYGCFPDPGDVALSIQRHHETKQDPAQQLLDAAKGAEPWLRHEANPPSKCSGTIGCQKCRLQAAIQKFEAGREK